MPIYEYLCKKCGEKSEYLIRSSDQEPHCSCGSSQLERLMSTFAVSETGSNTNMACSDGNCGMPSSPCCSGMCGL
jgi:putative FmdB family regulatory protein